MGSVLIFMITISIPVYSIEKTQITIVVAQLILGVMDPYSPRHSSVLKYRPS